MANVTETSNFDAGIYQLETTDVLEGGALGVDNYQAKGLANRTRWLYDRIIELFKFAPKNRGYFTGLDIGVSSGSLARFGDVTSAVATAISGNSFITVNLANSMGNTNYKVNASVQSLGTLNVDNDVSTGVFAPISATQFQIGFREIDAQSQNLRIHIEVISLD